MKEMQGVHGSSFNYEDSTLAPQVERLASEIEGLWQGLVRLNIETMIELGRRLNQIKGILPHGQFESWLKWRLPWCLESSRQWRVAAKRMDSLSEQEQKERWADLKRFQSSTAAMAFLGENPDTQRAIIDREAFTWGEYNACQWIIKMDEHLRDPRIPELNRYGDVYYAIQEVIENPDASNPIREAALEIYEKNRTLFSRLEEESPAVIDVEMGVSDQIGSGPLRDREETPNGKRGDSDREKYIAQLIEDESGTNWSMRWNGRGVFPTEALQALGFDQIKRIDSLVIMGNGSPRKDPITLALFPATANEIPLATSWQLALRTAACNRVGAKTIEDSFYRKVGREI